MLSLLAATAITVVRMRDLWAAVMLTGIYSFLGAGWMVILDAPDVAFTEAAVGAGISTFLMLGTLALTSRKAKPPSDSPVLPLVVVVLTGAALVFGTFDMPHFGDPAAVAHQHLVPEFMADTVPHHQQDRALLDRPIVQESSPEAQTQAGEHARDLAHGVDSGGDGSDEPVLHHGTHDGVGVPNIVTAVLASYRGYDTLGETVVVFTAGIGVLLLLRGKREKRLEPNSAKRLAARAGDNSDHPLSEDESA